MFKNLSVYQIQPGWKLTTAQIEAGLSLVRFAQCGATQEKSVGWSEPRGEAHAMLAEAVNGHLLLRFTTETKMLPANVVRRAAEERIEKLETQTGRTLGRAEKRDIREEMRLELLPRAFTRIAHTWVWIDRAHGFLCLDTASPTRADEVVAALLRCLDDLELSPVQTQSSPAVQMSAWLIAHDAPGHFDIEEECELKATDDSQAVVRYSKHSLNNAEVRKHIQNGKLPTRLALTWNGRVGLVLTDTSVVKRLKFLDGVFPDSDPADTGGESREEAADRFETDWTIATGELGQLVPELIEALGGVAVTG
ncbi:MAG: recombination-associated protein RdgC [Burkholderiales bacterium]|nr:recombination-associated protein RdgC [Burkholderiales bacterium]